MNGFGHRLGGGSRFEGGSGGGGWRRGSLGWRSGFRAVFGNNLADRGKNFLHRRFMLGIGHRQLRNGPHSARGADIFNLKDSGAAWAKIALRNKPPGQAGKTG